MAYLVIGIVYLKYTYFDSWPRLCWLTEHNLQQLPPTIKLYILNSIKPTISLSTKIILNILHTLYTEQQLTCTIKSTKFVLNILYTLYTEPSYTFNYPPNLYYIYWTGKHLAIIKQPCSEQHHICTTATKVLHLLCIFCEVLNKSVYRDNEQPLTNL